MNAAAKRILLAAAIAKMNDTEINKLTEWVSSSDGLAITTKVDAEMQVIEYLRTVFVHGRKVSPNSMQECFVSAVNLFRKFLTREPLLLDLTIENLNGFASWVLKGRSRKTGRERSTAILSIWRSAADNGFIAWSDDVPIRPLTELLPFLASARQRDVANEIIYRMRRALGREPLARDLTEAAIEEYREVVPITVDGEKNVRRHERGLAIITELSKLAGSDPHESKSKRELRKEGVIAPAVSDRLPIQVTFDAIPGDDPDLFFTLDSVLTEILLEREMETVTAKQYDRSIRYFSRYLGHPALIRDLTVKNINGWMVSLSVTHEGATIRNHRIGITRLWNYLTEVGRIKGYDSKRIRKPKITRKPTFAWNKEELAILLKAAETVRGELRCGIHARDLMAAWVWVGYDVGLRPVDIFKLRFSDIDPQTGDVSIVQNKTGVSHNGCLSPEGLKALAMIAKPDREIVFPLKKWGTRRYALRLFKVAESMGFKKRRGQGLGTLRKSHATEIYKAWGTQAAAESLGHVGGERTAKKHYIDARAIHQGRLPPRLPV